MRGVTAVILGGGQGSRLLPLTERRAKPAVGFAGKYRLIDIPISNAIHADITRVYVLTQFMSASLHRHIMQTYQFDTFTDGFVDILAAAQTPRGSDWFQGTADAVRATLHHITYYDADQMLVLSGDHLYRMDYRELIQFHRQRGAQITLCVYPVTREEAPQLGLLQVDPAGTVQAFTEKPKDPRIIRQYRAPEALCRGAGLGVDSERYLASMGIYVFEPEVLVEALAEPSRTDFGKEVIPAAIGRYSVMAYPFSGYWKDIGTIGSFFEANIALAQPNPPFKLYEPRWPIFTRTRALPPSRVIQSDIRDSLLVEGSDITGAEISDSIVGMRSIIREQTVLSEVVMLGADFYEGETLLTPRPGGGEALPALGIGRGCHLERTIIDKNARIGDGVVIRAKNEGETHRDALHWVRDGITVIPKGAVIPPGTEL